MAMTTMQERRRDRPSVALVAHDIHDGGGMERVCAELIRQGQNEWKWVVVSSTLAQDLRPLVARWIRIPTMPRPFPAKFATFWLQASLRLLSLDVDLIHTVGAIVGNKADVAALHYCHAGFVDATGQWIPNGTPLLRRVNAAVARILALAGERWCYRPSRLRAFAAVSSGVGQEASRHYPRIPVHVTPNGVDHTRFRPDRAARELVRRQLALGGVPIAIFVGGDWDRKGLRIAIEALARVRSAGVDLRLWVVGSGDQVRFAGIANDLGVGSAITFLGVRNDVERFLAAADLFVFPSSYEAHPLVALEAAASGLPIVATKVHGIVDLVADDEAGILVDRTPESVADALVLLARDSELRERLVNGVLRSSGRYTWQASAESVMALYRLLLALPSEATA